MVGALRGADEPSSTATDSSTRSSFCLDEPDREPAFSAPERADARARGPLGGRLSPSCVSTSRRTPLDEARALPRSRRARDQAPPSSTGVRARDERLRRSSRSPSSATCRSSSTAAAAFRRSPSTSRRSSAATTASSSSSRTRASPTWPASPAGSAASPASSSTPRCGAALDLLDLYRQVSPEQVALRVRLPVRPTAELAARLRPDGEARRLRRQAATADARRNARRIAEREPPSRSRRPRARRRSSSR